MSQPDRERANPFAAWWKAIRHFSLWPAVRMALDTVREHKARSFLTVLGVIIGTGAVIAVGSIVTGMDSAISGIFRTFGPQTIIVFKFKVGFRTGMTNEELQRKPISLDDARALQDRCASCEFVSPYLFSPNFMTQGAEDHVRYGSEDIYQLKLAGTEEGYAQVMGVTMRHGRFLSEVDSQRRFPVAVIGQDLETALFPNVDPIGKLIEVDGHRFEVIGSMARTTASFPGMDDRRVLLPYFTMKKMFPNAKENMLVIGARNGQMAAALDEIESILRQSRRVPYDKPPSFAISTAEQLVEDFRKLMSVTAQVMIALSSIGLLVGGIGVMNIMLVSVTERTREIGVRKALGARRADIIAQFLTEAVVLTGLGGLLGMTLGWLVSVAARLVFPALPTQVPLWAAMLGVGVSVGIGLFFGIWPAAKAASLDPVVALRYE
ncbi:MAG: ABC transporter permease [Bryobacteraceae bacterium]